MRTYFYAGAVALILAAVSLPAQAQNASRMRAEAISAPQACHVECMDGCRSHFSHFEACPKQCQKLICQ
ncbi:MAG: hypothetical protein ACLP8A_10190 [Methylovirgula sp.]